VQKGFYFIAIRDTDKEGKEFNSITLQEGSFETKGKLIVHRRKEFSRFSDSWRVSHIQSGACIVRNKTLPDARRIAKAIQGLKLWELKTWACLQSAIAAGNEYREEVEHINRAIEGVRPDEKKD